MKSHSGKHLKFHLFKDSLEIKHKMVTLNNLKIIGNGYKKSNFRRKLVESLHIKEKRFPLNTQEASVLLKLFN